MDEDTFAFRAVPPNPRQAHCRDAGHRWPATRLRDFRKRHRNNLPRRSGERSQRLQIVAKSFCTISQPLTRPAHRTARNYTLTTKGRPTMTTNTDAEPAVYRENPPHGVNRSNPTGADKTLEFGRFCLSLATKRLAGSTASYCRRACAAEKRACCSAISSCL